MPFFREIYPRSGVDEDRNPPGIIVPLGGTNFVRLQGAPNLRLRSSSQLLEIRQVDSTAWPAVALGPLVLKPGFPPTTLSDVKYFSISSKHPIVAKVDAVGYGGAQATLDVAVLKPRNIKLSIRPVLIHGPDGTGLVMSSQRPFDVNDIVAQMNSYWTPQANVIFKLVGSTPLPLVDDDRYRKAYGNGDKSPLSQGLLVDRLRDVLADAPDPSADLTLLLVNLVGKKPGRDDSFASYDDGDSNLEAPLAYISDKRALMPELTAHEAGHIIGRQDIMHGPDFVHTKGQFDLMRDGGSVFGKIPYEDVIRSFNRQ
jgi:hypothetical protein